MAGLFEGEGYISVRVDKHKNSSHLPRVLLGLQMTDEDVVRRFASSAGAGNVNGPYPQKGLGTKPWWRWTTSAYDEVDRLLSEMWPGLCSRRRAKARQSMTMAQQARPERRREVQIRPASPPPPMESSPGLLPTPVVADSRNTRNATAGRSPGSSAHSGMTLCDAVQLLPTPRASERENRQTKRTPSQEAGDHGLCLAAEVIELLPTGGGLLPTPAARDWKSGQSNIMDRNARPLNEVVENWLLPTPLASDGGLNRGSSAGYGLRNVTREIARSQPGQAPPSGSGPGRSAATRPQSGSMSESSEGRSPRP